MSTMIGYSDIDSPIHKLTGASKLIALIIWAVASMITYDTRVLLGMFVISIIVFKISKVKFKQVSFVLYFILIFLLLNNIAIFIFSPYQFNITLKYFSIIPMALLFMVATNPSEFAASLNKIGVSYKIAYSVSIALRYIPDVQRDYQDISFAQQARGIDMSKKEKLTKRIKNSASILMPLIFSSLDRIEAISSAMELRAFGSNKKRTWYNGRPFKLGDYITILVVSIILIIAIMATISNGGRFYNPFI